MGRSNIVGMPVAMLLNKRDATVTICHSGTKVRPTHTHTHTQSARARERERERERLTDRHAHARTHISAPTAHMCMEDVSCVFSSGTSVYVCLCVCVCQQDMAAVVQQADIVIAACGQANLIKGSWIKPGAAVIDVGTNPVPDSTKKAGFR